MRVTFEGHWWRLRVADWRREKIVRSSVVAGLLVLVLILVLSMCGSPAPGSTSEPGEKAQPAHTRFEVPAAYDTERGWDVREASDTYALAQSTGSVALLEDAGDDRIRLRAVDVTTGRTRWTGAAWHPDGSWTSPRLLTATGGGREFFAVWSYGDTNDSVLHDPEKAVSLDLYDAAYGTRRHLVVPWSQAPDVVGGSAGILIGRGSDHAAVIDAAKAEVTRVEAKKLGYPKDCSSCHRDTDVRGLTSHGLVVRGSREFWLRGGWRGRSHAPKGTDAASGVPTSVTADRVLVKWQKEKKKPKKGQKSTTELETWAVHDAATGKVLAAVDCHRPAVDPGHYPDMAFSFSGRYVVAGPLALDLKEHKGHCFDESDHGSTPSGDEVNAPDPGDPAVDRGPRPLALTTVTDQGIAYGTTSAHGATGRPQEVSLDDLTARPLKPTVHLPVADLGGYGLFPYTDGKDVRHLVGYPRRTTDG